jgi:hypothetical protein
MDIYSDIKERKIERAEISGVQLGGKETLDLVF